MKYLVLVAVSTCFFACTSTTQKADKTSALHLNAGNLYNADTVLMVAHASEGKDPESDKLFLSAIDSYRNKKKPADAVKQFKASIMQKPQAKAYYEMGNALSDLKLTEQAIQAYKMAELLDYKPLSKVLYNLACAYSISGDYEKSKYYLVSAIEFGYNNAKNIYADKDLAQLRENYSFEFRRLVTAALSGATDVEKLQWNQFWHEFKQVSFPLQLDMKYGEKLQEGEVIAYDYERFVPEMRESQFSRDVGSEYYHVGLVKGTDSVKTLIYAVKDMTTGMMTPPYYYIVSFDKKGTLIDKLLISGQIKLDDPFKVATVRENGTIQIGLFKQIYEKDPATEGYEEDNKLLESKEIGKEVYQIASDGHFVKQQDLLSMN